ncbi:hypothetical protein AVEN_248570-1, partial [Araneus ventricosus]
SQSESEDELNNSFESDHEFDSDYENCSSSTNEEEDNLNTSRGRKRLLTDSQDDREESNKRQNIEIAVDGTVWKKIEANYFPDRSLLHPDSFGDYLHSNSVVSRRHLVEIGI